MAVELRDVAPGLWLWRQPHPDWEAGAGWEPDVASFAVASRGVRLVLDALLPPPAARDVWERLEDLAPDVAVVLKPDHVRDVDLVVRWYGATAYGPQPFEHVLVSHGEPVHDRAAFVAALDREPWAVWSGA